MKQHHDYSSDYGKLKFHPMKIYFGLILMGLSIVFVCTIVSYIYTLFIRDTDPIVLPNIFYLNALLLIGTSYFMKLVNHSYRSDNTKDYKIWLIVTLIITLLFLWIQFVGWDQMKDQGLYLNTPNNAHVGFLYVLTILHFIHVLGGLVPLIWFIFVAYVRMKEPVSTLIYFADPEKHLRLRLLTYYWHFLDGMWILILVIFFFSTFIR